MMERRRRNITYLSALSTALDSSLAAMASIICFFLSGQSYLDGVENKDSIVVIADVARTGKRTVLKQQGSISAGTWLKQQGQHTDNV